MTPAAHTQREPARRQARWLLLSFAIALGACLVTDLVARNRPLEGWLTARSSELAVRNGKLFSNNGSFVDYEERILLDELPNADFSRGGIYFFGTSNMKWAFTTWNLPNGLRQRLGVYGTGGASHQTILRLVRYVGDRGLFASGAKSQVIIGVSYHLGTTETPASYFPALVHRQGLYEITPDDRLIETSMNPVERWLRTEKARSGGFIWNLGRLASNGVVASLGLSHQPPHDPEYYRSAWRMFMGPNWRKNIDREAGRLEETLALLHANNVPVKLILLPQGTWMDGLPYGPYYEERVRALARSTSTPLLHWSKALRDEDFIDSNHLTVAGQMKFRAMMLKEEADHLRRIGGD